MSTPLQYYQTLPPVAKTYAVVCLMTSSAYYLGLFDLSNISILYSDVFKRFQIWRLITNFFFLEPFSFTFAFRLLMILRYGISLERGPFDKRTADYLWMYIFGALSLLVMAAIPFLWSPFMGASLVFMIVYVWGREFPNERVNIHGLFQLKGFYLPWYMLTIDLILGNPLKPDMLGIGAGHIYYFLTVLYPLSTGKNFFETPLWVHKLVAFWGEGVQANAPVRRESSNWVAFRGRSYRLGGVTGGSRQAEARTPAELSNSTGSGVFRGRSHRLGG